MAWSWRLGAFSSWRLAAANIRRKLTLPVAGTKKLHVPEKHQKLQLQETAHAGKKPARAGNTQNCKCRKVLGGGYLRNLVVTKNCMCRKHKNCKCRKKCRQKTAGAGNCVLPKKSLSEPSTEIQNMSTMMNSSSNFTCANQAARKPQLSETMGAMPKTSRIFQDPNNWHRCIQKHRGQALKSKT